MGSMPMRVLLGVLLALPNADDPPVGKGPLLVLETFEATAPGQIPRGYQKTGEVAVVDGVAHTGRRSLRIEAATNGPRRITLKGDAAASLGGRHWGRLYFKVRLPAPAPAGDVRVIHSTLVAGSALSPQHADPIEVRLVDTVMNREGKLQFLYNVQPRKRPEFGKGSGYRYAFADRWTLAEWFVDHDTQTFRLFIDGEEVKDAGFSRGAGNFENAEIPAVFESLSFGWNNYQPAGAGFVAWIDDLALAKDRLGARGIVRRK